jgi:dihydrofolate synthase/folylpolyglutamate synthase
MSLLGNTIELIAAEKAGIIKQEIPVVISQAQGPEKEVFTKKALSCNAQIYFAEEFYHVQKSAEVNEYFSYDVVRINNTIKQKISCPLGGNYQQKNIAGVLTTIDILRENGWAIPEEKIYEGIKKVIDQTHLRGRWEQLGERPTIVADTAHNVAGIKLILEQISQNKFNHLHLVIGFVQDKDISGMLEILPKNASYYFCAAKIPRAMPSLELKQLAGIYGLNGQAFRTVKSALNAAKNKATAEDFIYIGGSTFVVAEVI